ncbi:MAG: NAD(P)H-binding protein [Pseudomonadota bacterium]|nr:NAD(P)H-binding protein [Pseudomonadota bacterium]
MTNISLVIGSTGLIGKKLLFELDKKGDEVIAVSRRSIKGISSNINVLIIDFNDFIVNGSFPTCDHVYICLGTTIKKAGSHHEFKKVDLSYCVALAKKAKESGAKRVSLVSSVGANSSAKNFYLKTKGELEEEIKSIDFNEINIFRPSLLLGQRGERRIIEKIGQHLSILINFFLVGPLRRYKCVPAETVAYSMANAKPEDGVRYFYFDDFQNV